MIEYVKQLLKEHERNAVWLSKKIGVSHTLVYCWLKGTRTLNPQHFELIMGIFDIPFHIAKDKMKGNNK